MSWASCRSKAADRFLDHSVERTLIASEEKSDDEILGCLGFREIKTQIAAFIKENIGHTLYYNPKRLSTLHGFSRFTYRYNVVLIYAAFCRCPRYCST